MEDSLLEVVKGEVVLMRSAYSKEFTDLRENDPWKVYRAPDVKVKLGPHHSYGGTLHHHVWVTLRIKTSDRYPLESAEVKVENYDGLSTAEVETLADQLEKKAVECANKGMVVMMELCQLTQSYLGEHARPYKDSIYEEMMAGQEAKRQASVEAEREILRQREKREEEQRSLMRQEVARIEEKLKEEERQRKENKFRLPFMVDIGAEKSQSVKSKESPNHGRLKNRSISECSSESGSGENQGLSMMRFPLSGKQERTVIVLRCKWERANQGCFLYEAHDKNSYERCVIYEWSVNSKRIGRKGNHIKTGQENALEELVNKFSAQEKEMSSLLRLSHENLVSYMGMKLNHRKKEGVDVYILQEHVHGMSMKHYVDLQLAVNEDILRYIAEGTLKALNFLHQNNVVHRDLRDSSIFLDNQSRLVRVADYGVERKVVEAVLEFNNIQVQPLYPASPGRGGKKGDIFRLGLVILSIYQGRRIQEIVPTVPSSLSADFKNFIQKCLALNEQERWTVEKLLNHPFIKLQPSERNGVESTVDRITSEQHNNQLVEEEVNPREAHELSSETQSNSTRLKPGIIGVRIKEEYNILEFLGKGGFGNVYKVQNKVDDRVYAVKRIPLHEQIESVKKKIIREVKLLSSLDHENVVRYYTSWIENLIQEEESKEPEDESSESEYSSECISQVTPVKDSHDETGSFGKPHELKEESEWSIIFHDGTDQGSFSQAHNAEEESDDDDDDDDDDDWLMGSLRPMLRDSDDDEDEDDIVYKDDVMKDEDFSDSDDSDLETDYARDETDGIQTSKQVKKQYLFIQMQLCEKNTLRQAINEHLHLDPDRKWRLFREIVSGLDYIHSQGLIHRDLKPGNIFLDSNDHVKIGDFGLATAAIKAKTTAGAITMRDTEDTKDSTLTGQIGTTFYIAPEVKAAGKGSYTNKVDIYSLGVIFFEMVHPPLTTGMERAQVLHDLTKPEIIIPKELSKKKNAKSFQLIEWLLQHDPQQRPTTKEILNSPLLPPPTAEEQKFIRTLETKLENPRSSDYQDILNRVFKPAESMRPETEAIFVMKHPISSDYWQYWKHDYLHSLVTGVFKAHGAIWVPTLFYVPKGSFYNDKDNLVSLMSRGGELVSAQYELRYPFARLVARNEIKHMRRYCIDRVLRAFKVSGIHPKESYECAFDITSSKKDAAESAARVILVAHDIVQQIIREQSENVVVRLGHLELVRAILFHCGIEEKLHLQVIRILKEYNSQRMTLEKIWEFLQELNLSRSSIESLKGFLFLDGPIEDIITTLSGKGLTTKKRNALPKAKQVLAELKEIVETSVIFGVKFEISVCPLMVADATLYCGFMCQFLLNVRNKKKQTQELLVQGGSYERLIMNHRSKLIERSTNVPYAVGISLFLEKFSSCIPNVPQLTEEGRRDVSQLVAELGCGAADVTVMVCAIGSKLLKERVYITRDLRKMRITADHCFFSAQEEAESFLEDLHVTCVVQLTNSGYPFVRVYQESAGWTLDRKVSLEGVVEFICKSLGSADPLPPPISRSDSKSINVSSFEDEQIKIHYFTRRHSKNRDAGKRDEQIIREVNASLIRWPNIDPKVQIEVWAVELEKKALLFLGALDTDYKAKNFNDSLNEIKSLFPDHKEHIEDICRHLEAKIFQRKKSDRCCLVLYSLISNTVKRIL